MVLTASEEDHAVANRFLYLGGHYENTGGTLTTIAKELGKLNNETDTTGLIELIDKCVYDLNKAVQIERAIVKEMNSFDQLARNEKQQLEQIKKDIEVLKADLKHATEEKKHKDNCDFFASLILKNPARTETISQVEQVTKEIEELNSSIEIRRAQLDLKKKQFSLLFHALGMLKEDQEREERELLAQREAVAADVDTGSIEEGLIEEDADTDVAMGGTEEGEVVQTN
jgi:chromosome segregation ATPase